MSSPPPVTRRYPGRCIMFNLAKVIRLKKRQEGHAKPIVSESWTNEDDDNFLVVRIMYTNGSPWICSHHGLSETLRGTCIVFIREADIKANVVSIRVRDFANRGEQCIKRNFVLHFNSSTDARVFKYAYNSVLSEYNRKEGDTNEEGKKVIEATKKNTDKENKAPLLPKSRRAVSSLHEEDVCFKRRAIYNASSSTCILSPDSMHRDKRRRIANEEDGSNDTTSVGEELINDKGLEKKETQNRTEKEEEEGNEEEGTEEEDDKGGVDVQTKDNEVCQAEYLSSLTLFETKDQFSSIDDTFENTQDPYASL